MYKEKTICVLVPAFNEERFISTVITTTPKFVDRIIVVDDCSTDQTYEIASNSGDERVIVLRHKVNQGVGGAVITGYKRALELRFDIIVKMDGDGQMPPAYLPNLLDSIIENDYDYAKGNRFLGKGSLLDMPKHRVFGNFVLTFMTKLASGYWNIFDPQNGYTAVKRTVLESIELGRLSKGYTFENDMLVHLSIHKFRVKDVSMPPIYGSEQSKVKLHRILFSFPPFLFAKFWYRMYQKYVLRDFSPIILFLFFGCILFTWGFVFGALTWYRSAISGRISSTGTVMLSVLPLIMGFELLLQAIVLDINETPK